MKPWPPALSSCSSPGRIILPCIWYLRPFIDSRSGLCVLPSSSHLAENSGTSVSSRASKREPETPHMLKNIWLAQMTRKSLNENTAMGSGKFRSVLFLAVSAS